jgi:hypothetical protein
MSVAPPLKPQPTAAPPGADDVGDDFRPHGIQHGRKNLKLIELNYKRNSESDYTARLIECQKTFDYEAERDAAWLDDEFSLLYGTPLYDQASAEQRRALNHLYWVCFYNYSVGGEVSTMVYNQLTTGALYPLGGYETVCKELDLETSQERDHVEAFRRVAGLTEQAMIGETIFLRPVPHYLEAALIKPQQGRSWRGLRVLPMAIYTGVMGYSPFLATQYYILRGIRNIQLKVKEYQHSQRAQALQQTGERTPAATAISHYHYQDEAFHTATSQAIAKDLYKDFRKPTRLEVFFANEGTRKVQLTLNRLSGAVPGIFSSDDQYMPQVYRLLQSRVFGMTPDEALAMTERCFCEEHDGLHAAAKYHGRALHDARNYVADMAYMTPNNRSLSYMAAGATIERAIQENVRAFRRFRRTAQTLRKKSGTPTGTAGMA